ncbi:MAG: hypothetical protein KDB79_09835 [Acidobacteria bacterium]|nr:hypothetical protein [Acidobacteriota bacterium]
MKKATVYSVALFIVVFALADVSFLQAYHGNESMGIPPAHHTGQENDCPEELNQKKTIQTNSDATFFTNHDHNSEKDCSDEGECLASCSHIVVGCFVFESFVCCETPLSQNSLHRENTTPKSELSAIFRPPQIA